MRKLLVAALLCMFLSALTVSGAPKNVKSLTRQQALVILKAHEARLLQYLTHDFLILPSPLWVTGVQASEDEANFRTPLAIPSMKDFNSWLSTFEPNYKSLFERGFVQCSFALAAEHDHLVKITKINNGTQFFLGAGTIPGIELTTAPADAVSSDIMASSGGLHVVVDRASFIEVTGISGEGVARVVEATSQSKATAAFGRVRAVAQQVVNDTLGSPQNLQNIRCSSWNANGSFTICDVLSYPAESKRYSNSYEFRLYDDGWRVVER